MMASTYSIIRPPAVEGIAELVRGGVDQLTSGHPPHWHSEWQLVAVTRGDGWVRVGGTQHRTPAGSLFFIPPGIVHSNGVFATGCDFRSMLISSETVEGVTKAAGLRLQRLQISKAPVICSQKLTTRFDRFHQSLEHPAPDLDLELESSLADWVCDLVCSRTGQNVAQPNLIAHPAATKARDCLWDRASDKVTLTELANEVGLSRFELSRQFKAAFGLPPHAWLLQARIQKSKTMLQKRQDLSSVALECGFSDQAHFNRVFRRATGYTPGRYAAEWAR